ncbi:MAG: PEGA domain-containing protein [Magnetococcales bacterium]|nr:PEGA domain-containing protein [Magnetococcales bacterium]
MLGRLLGIGFAVLSVVLSFSAFPARGAVGNISGGGSLLVKVVPRGAEVLVDDQVVGVAPIQIDKIRPGRVQVRARLPGYRSWGKSVVIHEKETTAVTLILSRSSQVGSFRTGILEIRSEPPGAQWLLDGEGGGITPARVEEVAVGDHKISVTLPGFAEKSTDITVIGGELHQVLIRLESEGAQFWLDTVPSQATIRFKKEGLTYQPGMYLLDGRYDLNISHPGYIPVDIVVDIEQRDWSDRIQLEPDGKAPPSPKE